MSEQKKLSRRRAVKLGVAASLGGAVSPVFGQETTEPGVTINRTITQANISAYRSQNWRDHFSDISSGAILADLNSFALHYWNSSQDIYRVYPIAIPLREEFVRRGTTSIVRKKDGPSWSPTANMLARDPSLPSFVGPGPLNPLGTHALYLGWQYYIIHGNNDTRKIGRTSSSGCIGLYNEHIEELFGLANVGTTVKVI